MATIRRDERGIPGGVLQGEPQDVEAQDVEAQDLDAQVRRADPVWPGFRAARLITSMKIRGDARSTLVLALLIVAATLAVLGAAHVGPVAEDLGGFFGLSLRASESAY
ncbi:hypothetical protein [Salinarimonas chemoclinalis]|uniref:hypothetical protein n=1 Tax=Salinarimonas chemoclinalis TaxID=3241599 RepID=UPI003555BF24